MNTPTPLVSVSMIAYNAQDFIRLAIEGVLNQQVDFPIELVIGDDASPDGTRQICENYAAQYPDIIRLLPPESNLGIAANTRRTMGQCRGKYIAVCDGDDVWTDPLKLRQQVAFLESHPDYGVVYTDVETVSETGATIPDPEQDQIRSHYAQGDVFVELLGSNFINNSTALFRRELIRDHIVDPGRDYQIPDYLRWLHIAAGARIHLLPYASTQYRRHTAGLSVNAPRAVIRGNRRAFYRALCAIIPRFDRYNQRPLTTAERMFLFRRMCSLVLRGPGSPAQRGQILRMLPRYYPGMSGMFKIGMDKMQYVLQEWYPIPSLFRLLSLQILPTLQNFLLESPVIS